MPDSNSNMTIEWTDLDKEILQKREVFIFKQNTDERGLVPPETPTDVHLITFTHNGQEYTDAVRGARMVDIFDCYFDKLKSVGGGEITRIRNGFGTISPKRYNPDGDKKKEKKDKEKD